MTTGITGGCIKCRKLERIWLHYYCGRKRLTEKQVYDTSGYCSRFEPKETAENQTKKMTNADRIRSMTDEELAGFLDDVSNGCDNCPKRRYCLFDTEEENCRDAFLKWLKEEVKDDSRSAQKEACR